MAQKLQAEPGPQDAQNSPQAGAHWPTEKTHTIPSPHWSWEEQKLPPVVTLVDGPDVVEVDELVEPLLLDAL